jgi:predicted transcriptional regulator of viral defense system
MNEREFIQRCRALGLSVMTTSDIQRIAGMACPGLNMFLHRLQMRGAIERLERGKYYLAESPLESLASSMVSPSYISFLYALSLNHLTTQIPRQIVVVSLRSRPGVELKGHRVEIMKIKKGRFFGMERKRVGGRFFATVATVEKAILDSLAYPLHCPVAEAAHALSTGLDEGVLKIDLLADMTKRFGSHVAAKRLGYLAELSGADLFGRLGPMVNPRYDLLNPGLPPKGPRNARWRLTINEEA